MIDLAEKVIVVTGGGRGIGGAAARLCAMQGAHVMMADIEKDVGEAAAAAIREAGGDARFLRTDVRHADEVGNLMDHVRVKHGRLDALVCAAGVCRGAYLQPEEVPIDVFEDVIDVNVKGSFLCAKYASPLLEASQRGVVVLIASGAGVTGPSSSIAYATSKGGVNGLGITLAKYLEPRNIRVNVLCPGSIETVMKLEIIAEAAERQGRSPDQAVEAAKKELGSPDGVGRVIAFLVSDAADYVRGTLFTR